MNTTTHENPGENWKSNATSEKFLPAIRSFLLPKMDKCMKMFKIFFALAFRWEVNSVMLWLEFRPFFEQHSNLDNSLHRCLWLCAKLYVPYAIMGWNSLKFTFESVFYCPCLFNFTRYFMKRPWVWEYDFRNHFIVKCASTLILVVTYYWISKWQLGTPC